MLVLAIPEENSPDLSAEWAYDERRSVVLGQVFERLIGRDPETNELIPILATSWEQVDDLTWTITLREGVIFHDGSELNAESAAISLNYVYRPDGRLFELSGKQYAFEPVGEYALEVQLSEPDPLLLSRLTQAHIPSPRQIEEDPESHPLEPIGSGPYVLTEFVPQSFYIFERNDDWWGLDGSHPLGVPRSPPYGWTFDPRRRPGLLRSLLARPTLL